jgi:outer membrane protein OmpA-like peptidoglycan-associated protein
MRPIGPPAAALAAALLATGPALAQQAGAPRPLVLEGQALSEAQDCSGRDVVVRGNANALRFTGGCRSLSVQGNGNSVLAEMAPGSRIEVLGSGSTVGWTLSGQGAAPSVSVTGRDSRAEAAQPGTATVTGAPRRAEPGPLLIEGSGQQRSLDCTGREVVVRGDRNALTLTGGCRALRVEGNTSDIRAALAPGAPVVLRGNVLDLAWSQAAPGPEPRITTEGQQIRVQRAAQAITAPADAAGRVGRQETARGVTLTLSGDVLFGFDSDRLRPEAAEALAEVADVIREARPRSMRIIGHTDALGAEAYNQDLSLRRARSVQRWLEERAGGAMPAVVVDGRGEADPVAPNTMPDGRDNPAGRAQNRRVEIALER